MVAARDHWPTESDPNDAGLAILAEAFRSLGFEECKNDSLESGFEKVALYGSNGFLSTHAARQLPDGKNGRANWGVRKTLNTTLQMTWQVGSMERYINL